MRRTFLLADDDSDDRDLFMLAMEKVASPFDCITVKNGKEAIELLKTSSAPFDLVFLDLNMPVMNGWECAEKLKTDSKLKSIPIIIYSTSSAQKDITYAKDIGVKCFFTKPDNFVGLYETLMLIIRKIDENCFGTIQKDRQQKYLECFC